MCGLPQTEFDKLEESVFQSIVGLFHSLRLETQQALVDRLSDIWINNRKEFIKKRAETLETCEKQNEREWEEFRKWKNQK